MTLGILIGFMDFSGTDNLDIPFNFVKSREAIPHSKGD